MITPRSKLQAPWLLALCALPLAWLWGVLINDLRVEWSLNPQYAYGWAVPFLCVFLVIRRWYQGAQSQKPGAGSRLQAPSSKLQARWPSVSGLRISTFYILLSALAFCYLPARLIQEANPGWRLVSWALAISVIGLTLCMLRPVLGAARWQVSDFRFPILFFLVAVPWPTLLEAPLIQALTRADVHATCDLAGWLGIPAIPHANVIEVATGLVGIDEACSGIRSFQATLMISLFLGEYYALGLARRVFCVGCGFLLALLLNLVRLLVLVWVAAHQGISATNQWHDSTGVGILLGCFIMLWGIGVWLAPRREGGGRRTEGRRQMADGRWQMVDGGSLKAEGRGRRAEGGRQRSEDRGQKAEGGEQSTRISPLQAPSSKLQAFRSQFSNFKFPLSALALTVWLLLAEAGVEGWYRFHEVRLPAAVTWQVAWPTNNVTFANRGIAPESQRILRFDDGQNAAWLENNLGWQVAFLQWEPGQVAVRLAQNHTPEICLAAVGHQLTGGKELQFLNVHGLKMPFRFYQFTDTPQPMFVAYCLWNDRASSREFATSSLRASSRIAAVLAGQRNAGQRSIEIALTGVSDLTAAQTAVQQLLEKIIVPGP